LVHITITNDSGKTENIDTTVRHPFYVVDYGFKYASELKIGDKVKSVDGDIYEVSNVDSEKLAKPVKVYNFEVEDWHTYFVSEEMILVHNMCAKKSDESVLKKRKMKKRHREVRLNLNMFLRKNMIRFMDGGVKILFQI